MLVEDRPGAAGIAAKGWRAGTHRTRPPAATFAAIEPHLDAVGITRIAEVTGLDNIGIPVFLAIRPASWSLSVSQGKGLDPEAAKTSAAMESIESWCAERSEPSLRASIDDVGDAAVVDPATVRSGLGDVSSDRVIPWSKGVDAVTGTPVLVPHDVVHLDFRCDRPEPSWFVRGSNGLASGNVAAEAAVHAITELIERDALARFRHRPTERRWSRRVDLATVTDALCRDALDRLTEAAVAVSLWDVTSGLGVPTYLCAIGDAAVNSFRRMPPARGSGCHLDPGVAMLRALTEAAQCRLTVIAGSRDDHDPVGYERLRDPASDAIVEAAGDPLPPRPVDVSGTEDQSSHDFDADLETLVRRLRDHDSSRVVLVDIPTRGLPVAVVRAVVPGLWS